MDDNTTQAVKYLAEALVFIMFFCFACGRSKGHHSALLPVFDAEIARADAAEIAPKIAAQIEAESAWRPDARSRYAAGLAQFTPPTWREISAATDPSCAAAPATDAACSIRAQIVYMRQLLGRYRYDREPWPLAWAAYNGGMGWIDREKSVCRRRPNCDPTRWYSHIERHCIRAAWACHENRAYPRRVAAATANYRSE